MPEIQLYRLAVLPKNIGAVSLLGLGRIGRMGVFLARAFLYSVTPPLKVSRVLKQIRFIGFQSMLVIFLTGTFAGMVLGLQGFYTLNRFGSGAFLGPMVALALIKELGPVLSGLMVTGRAGSAVTAEIGISARGFASARAFRTAFSA